jgi:hypothetical protein
LPAYFFKRKNRKKESAFFKAGTGKKQGFRPLYGGWACGKAKRAGSLLFNQGMALRVCLALTLCCLFVCCFCLLLTGSFQSVRKGWILKKKPPKKGALIVLTATCQPVD